MIHEMNKKSDEFHLRELYERLLDSSLQYVSFRHVYGSDKTALQLKFDARLCRTHDDIVSCIGEYLKRKKRKGLGKKDRKIIRNLKYMYREACSWNKSGMGTFYCGEFAKTDPDNVTAATLSGLNF